MPLSILKFVSTGLRKTWS